MTINHTFKFRLRGASAWRCLECRITWIGGTRHHYLTFRSFDRIS